MNWNQIQGNCKQVMGKVTEQWGRLTGNTTDIASGCREHLAGKMQVRYGTAKSQAEKHFIQWEHHPSASWLTAKPPTY
jgi:uncharacterized protein YjbJ (UPF0337 family)